jgi:hypothetical protein
MKPLLLAGMAGSGGVPGCIDTRIMKGFRLGALLWPVHALWAPLRAPGLVHGALLDHLFRYRSRR